MNICILTRPDLLPTNHGAAVKIVQTARSIAALGHGCVIVTEDRDHYWRVSAEGDLIQIQYPARSRAMQEWPFFQSGHYWSSRMCKTLGYPEEEIFLYASQFDPAWLVRVLSVGMVEAINVFQAEFPGYGVVAGFAGKILSILQKKPVRSSIVQHNVEWERLYHYGHQSNWIRRLERLALRWVDDVIAVSDADKQLMIEMGIENDKITVVPHGVDVAEIREAKQRRNKWRKQYNLQNQRVVFFHGTLHYAPNTDAVRFIAKDLLPLLMNDTRFDDVVFVISGLNPPLYYSHPKIVFTDVVTDLAGHLQMADMFICPLFAGGGTRLKLLEYLATGKAIITTHKGAEGIPYHGQFQYAETPEEFVEALAYELTGLNDSLDLRMQRIMYAQRLAWDTVTSEYLNLYQPQSVTRGTDRFVDLLARNHVLGQETIHLPHYKPSKPKTLLFLINRGCNLKCVFCDLWDNPENIRLEHVTGILDDAVAIGTKIVVLTGGEPLMHPKIQAIVEMIKRRGMTVNITTNGLLLKRNWNWIKHSGVDSLSFSFDGFADVHDTLRRQQGAFDLTMKAIRTVLEESRIPCSVYCTVTNQNVHQLLDLHHMFWTMGVNFDFWPVNDAPDLYLTTERDKRLWKQAVAEIIQREGRYASRRSFYADSLKYHDGTVVENRRCLGFVEQYGIKYNGDLLPCCVWEGEGLTVGNVFETSLQELWYSEDVQNVRKSMVREGCSVPCFNHSLYEYRDAIDFESG